MLRNILVGTLSILVVLAASNCGDEETTTFPPPDTELEDFQNCQIDDDCRAVTDPCSCGCGPYVSINKNLIPEFRDQFVCPQLLCEPEIVDCPPIATVECQEGLCGFVEGEL